MKLKKRIFQFNNANDFKFKAVVNYLIDSMVDFTSSYKADIGSTIEFVCNDQFYETMLEEVPRVYRESIR